jgi:D-glucosaminate-6-phosphate ammonia-lyase
MSRPGERKMTRRRLLQAGAGAAVGSPVAGSTEAAPPTKSSLYQSLGIKPVINAAGTFTALGGSVMPPEVVAAWTEAAKHFVDLASLQDQVGTRIAALVGVEAALVTTGAAGAMLLGTAAAVTRGDPKLIARLPETNGMKNEVILQKTHHSCYDNQLTDVGVKLIDVETPADIARAVTEKTALMFFMNTAENAGQIQRKEWIELARKHGVPSLVDAAADVPPVERIAEYARIGFELIAISGGKAIRGPNDTGLLLGQKVLIDAAKMNTNPHCGTIGRMMKVGKEDLVALLVAVERFVKLDHTAEWKELERRLGAIESAVKQIPTIECERIVPPIANHVPHVQIIWDEKRVKISREEVTRALSQGEPPIRIGRVAGTGDKGILISVLTLQEGEDRVVADRLAEILRKAAQ